MENYFYCKYGGIMSACSNCVRNHINSPYQTNDITTWFVPNRMNGKKCSGYAKNKNDANKQEDFLDY